MDIENTKRSQVKIQKTAGVEQCFPGWVILMVAARMMVPLRGDLATRLAPQRLWFAMEVEARCLYWLSWLWHTKDGKLMVKLSGQRSLQETARARHDAFGASSLLQISKSQCRPERPGRSGCGGAIRQSKGPEFHADRNAHNRPEPGIKFYIHVSDRFVPFWAKLRGLHGYGLP